jgi:hypothetical protein
MYIVSDYETQVIIIPSKGNTKLEQVYYRIIKSDLFIFAGLIWNKITGLLDL